MSQGQSVRATQRQRTPEFSGEAPRRGRRQLTGEVAAFSALAILLAVALLMVLAVG